MPGMKGKKVSAVSEFVNGPDGREPCLFATEPTIGRIPTRITANAAQSGTSVSVDLELHKEHP